MLICEKCFEHLARQSTRLARAWTDLISLSEFIGDDLQLSDPTESKDRLIQRLEQEGYVLTTDTDEFIILRIVKQGATACRDKNH